MISGKKAAVLMIGVLVCIPLFAFYHFGVFDELSGWLDRVYHQIFVLPFAALTKSAPIQYAFFTAMAFITAWICVELPRQSRKFGFLFGAAFLTMTLSPVLAFNGLLFEPFSGLAAILAGGLLGIAVSGTEKGQRQHIIRKFFVGRISTEAFNKLNEAREPLTLTSRRDITVMTCRVLNYPDLGAQMEPEEIEKLSSSFLKVVAEFLVTKGAYLDSCNAEGVRVFFGFPMRDEQHAVTACKVALELRQRLANLTQEMENRWHRKPVFGAALASGEMTCGMFGFREFQFYGAVGEAVDFSRRLCALNGVYGSTLLLNARTFTLVKESMEVRPMEMVFAPRIHQVSEVYELLGEHGALSEEVLRARDCFWQGVVQMRKGDYRQAVESFKKAISEGREDPPLKYFIERAEAGAREDSGAVDPKGSARHVRLLMAS